MRRDLRTSGGSGSVVFSGLLRCARDFIFARPSNHWFSSGSRLRRFGKIASFNVGGYSSTLDKQRLLQVRRRRFGNRTRSHPCCGLFSSQQFIVFVAKNQAACAIVLFSASDDSHRVGPFRTLILFRCVSDPSFCSVRSLFILSAPSPQ